MLIHLSIPANNPEHVASVLAELVSGTYRPFGPVSGGFMVFTHNQFANGIEVYPDDTLIIPGKDLEPSQFMQTKDIPEFSALHFAMAVNLDKQTIMGIAKREQWRCFPHRRGNSFNVVEFWLENRVLVELVTPDDLDEALLVLKS